MNKNYLLITSLALAMLGLNGCNSVGGSSKSGLTHSKQANILNTVKASRESQPTSPLKFELPKKDKEKKVALDPILILEGKTDNNFNAKLYLDEAGHQYGHLLINVNYALSQDANDSQKWDILAYQLDGDIDDDKLQYIYTLTNSDNQLAYLHLLAGQYEDDKKITYHAYEGTLITGGEPGYQKIDFGYRFKTVPDFQMSIDKLSDKLEANQDTLDSLDNTSSDIKDATNKIAKLQKQQNDPKNKTDKMPEIEALKQSKTVLEEKHKTTQDTVLQQFNDVFNTRTLVIEQYADFFVSNHYRWVTNGTKTDYFNEWSDTKALDEKIKKQIGQAKTHLDKNKLSDRHAKMLTDVIAANHKAKEPK